jgi:hypothetical protein
MHTRRHTSRCALKLLASPSTYATSHLRPLPAMNSTRPLNHSPSRGQYTSTCSPRSHSQPPCAMRALAAAHPPAKCCRWRASSASASASCTCDSGMYGASLGAGRPGGALNAPTATCARASCNLSHLKIHPLCGRDWTTYSLQADASVVAPACPAGSQVVRIWSPREADVCLRGASLLRRWPTQGRSSQRAGS